MLLKLIKVIPKGFILFFNRRQDNLVSMTIVSIDFECYFLIFSHIFSVKFNFSIIYILGICFFNQHRIKDE